ncbi:unnamed protein product [Caenorhabditis bovis]|uniref:Uncharacterized protein n=1 Tax=Caenorhabditis bovis TaxID=2654633 RepID=A0A8S1F730_9PELO|nr:unnamed protein product [Caenorhabditis bovis]
MTSVELAYQELVRQLRDGMISISNDIEDKYDKLKPALNIPATARRIFDRLENLEELADMKRNEVSSLLDECGKENTTRLVEYKQQASTCEKLLEFIQVMKSIEEQLIILRSSSSDTMKWGQALIACKEHLRDANAQAEEILKDGYDMTAALKNFAAEYSQMNFQCRYFLSAEYEIHMKLPKISKQTSDKSNISMTIVKVGDPVHLEKLNQSLTAMNMIGQLNERLENWKSIIVDVFCSAIVKSRDGQNVFLIQEPIPKNFKFILLPSPKNANKKSMDVEKVLTSMEEFFAQLADVLGDLTLLDASMQSFRSAIGKYIEEPLIKIILTDVIAIAAPLCESGDADQEAFCKLIERGERFVDYMKELKFFTQASKLVYNFDRETIFINRRCFAIVTRANKLINESYTNMKTVGSSTEQRAGESLIQDSIEQVICKKMEEKAPNLAKLFRREGEYPSLFAIQKCTVSTSAVEFVELLRDVMTAAIEMTDEASREKLSTTAQNIVRLYVIVSPRKHAESFTSVPHIAAMFYNNCHYIAHCIMTMPFEVGNKDSMKVFEALIADSIVRLRDAAADCLEQTLIRSRRDLSVYLDDHQAFEHFPQNYKMQQNAFMNTISTSSSHSSTDTKGEPKLVQSLAACVLYINSIAKTFRDVMTEIVYCKSIASLVSFLLDSVTRHILSTSDIRENDANAMANIFNNLLQAIDEILMYRDKGRATEFCSVEYFRLREIIFVLGNRMQDIEMRWFNGKGPLAEHLNRAEIVKLIQALFADSEKRAETLNRL